MSGKDPNAFRTISEVAAELNLPQHVLRFWETKFSQIRPMKRSSGRRFYRPEDVELVRTIRDLLYNQGYTIRGVQRLFKERRMRSPTDISDARDGGPDRAVRDHSAVMSGEDEAQVSPRFIDRDLVTRVHREISECIRLLQNARLS